MASKPLRKSSNDLSVIRSGERWAYVLQRFYNENGRSYYKVAARIAVQPLQDS